MTNKIQLRRDTTANWARVNPILDDGEPGLDITLNQIKYGDGSTAWNDLAYAGGSPDRLTKDSHAVILDADGKLNFEYGNAYIQSGMGFHFVSDEPIDISSYGNHWNFNTDGTLTLPNGLTFSAGAQIFEQADHIGASWATGLNIRGSYTNDPIRIYAYGGDSKGYNAAGIVVNQHNVIIYGNSLQPSSPGTAWTFGSDGSTTLPLGGTVKETQFVSGGGIGGDDLQGTLVLTPNGAYNPWNNLTIYNTGFNAETQHLHLTSGDLNQTEIVLGDDNKFVKVNLDGSVCVQSSRYYLYNLAGTSGGSDTVISYANLNSIVSVGDYIIDAHGNAYQITGVTGTDPNWTIATNWASLTPLLASPYSFYKPTSTGGLWQFGADGSLTAPGAIYGGSNSIGLVTPAPLNLNNTGPIGQSKTQLNLINTAGNGGTGSAIDYYTYVDQGNGLPGARLSAVDDDNYSANFSIALKGRGNAGNNGLTTVWQFGSDGTLTFPNSTVQNTAWLGSTSTLVNGTSTLALNVDGTLTLPSGLTFSSGAQIFEQADHIGAGWATGLNIRGNNTTPSDPIRIYLYGEDGKGLGAGAVNVKSDRVEIYGNFQHDGVDGTFWTFSHDGSLTLPVGGAIKNSDGTTYGGTTYTLPAATSSALGGVKIGANISVTMDGTISVAAPFSGSYTDLTNKPTIPAAQVNSDWNASSGVSQILNKPSLFSGSYTDLTNTPNLATVATSGSYNDLSNKPTIGALSALNYVQVLGNTASPPSVSAGGTILSLTITTTGGPVELVGSGDANNTSAAFWGTVQWYRGASALGNQQFFESSSANENQSVTQVFIDNPAAGTYTYYWKMPRSSATITWGEGTTAPVISAKELQGIQGPTGPGMSYASGFVNAGTFVTMDNIKATVTTSGNRGLSLATVSGTATCYISGTYGMYGGSNTGGNSASFSMTTTPSNSCFGWSFGSEGDTATYILNYGYTKAYRITVMIGGAYNNNMISIERLV